MSGIILSTETESGSAALTASRVVTRHRRSGDVRSISIPSVQLNPIDTAFMFGVGAW